MGKMTLLLVLFSLLFVQHTSGELDYKIIQRSWKWESSDGKVRIRQKGPLNLLIGFLLNKTGVLYNKRFFSPEINPGYSILRDECDGRRFIYQRQFNKDTAGDGDEFHKMMLILFPSGSGTLSIAMDRTDSFFRILNNNKREASIRFMAFLIAASQIQDQEFCLLWTFSDTKNTLKLTVRQKEQIELVGRKMMHIRSAIIFFTSVDKTKGAFDSTINQYLMSRNFLLQGFIFHFLDTEDEVKMLLDTVHDFLKDMQSYDRCFAPVHDENNVDCTFVETIVHMNEVFPFSKENQPPSQMLVPFYNRREHKFVRGKTFADCTEIALLGFVCCVMYNSKAMRYSAEHLPGEAEKVKQFFALHPRLFTATQDSRMHWLSAIEDLEDKNIEYVKTPPNYATRNEIRSGLINFLVVLASVCGLRGKDFQSCLSQRSTPMPLQYGDVERQFECAFKRIVSAISLYRVNFEFKNMRVEKRRNAETWDVFGKVTLEIPVAGNRVAKVELRHTNGHAELAFVKGTFAMPEEGASEIRKKANALAQSSDTVDFLVGRYAQLSVSHDKDASGFHCAVAEDLEAGNMCGMFLHGTVNDNRHKLKLFDAIFPYARKRHEQGWGQVQHNIVASATLADPDILEKYAMFIVLDSDLTKRFSDLLSDMRMPDSETLSLAVREKCINIVCHCIEVGYGVNGRSPLRPLLELLMRHGKDSSIRKLVGVYRNSSLLFSVGLETAVGISNEPYAHYFFNQVEEKHLAECKHYAARPGIAEYFRRHIADRDAGQATLRKIYCWYFYANYEHETNDLCVLFGATQDRVSTDFVCDCMVRCPNFYKMFDFYEVFLKLAIETRTRVRNDAFFLIKHVVSLLEKNSKEVAVGEKKVAVWTSDADARGTLDMLIQGVEALDLVSRRAVFDEEAYASLVRTHPLEVESRRRMPVDFVEKADKILGSADR